MARRGPHARIAPAALALLAAAAACGRPLLRPFAPSAGAEPGSARIEVVNPQWEDLTVYLDREGTHFRLGVVPGNGRRTLTVPDDYVRANCWARLVALTTGRDQRGASEVFGLAPGDHAVWEIGLVGRSTPVRFTEPPSP